MPTPPPTAAGPRAPSEVMLPRQLAALPANPLSAARTLMDRMAREGWRITRVERELDAAGSGRLVYRIDTGERVLSAVAFSTEPRMVNRTPRIIGSSWDVVGALLDGEPDPERIEATREQMPRLYAGRAPEGTLIWFRANRSLRVFPAVVDALAQGRRPETELLEETGYLLRNTGLDGNGTFGTVDFAAYGDGHPLALPYHAQMLAAYMMREVSFDLVDGMAQARSGTSALPLPADLRRSIAVGNGSALGLVLFFMHRPKLVSRWIGLYEECAAAAVERPRDPADAGLDLFERLLHQTVADRDADGRAYQALPPGPMVAGDLRTLLRRTAAGRRAARAEGRSYTLAEALTALPAPVCPEAEQLFRSAALELERDLWEPRLRELSVDESVRPDPTWSAARLLEEARRTHGWIEHFAAAPDGRRNRVWYKSRASEEPRCGHAVEVPAGTHDLAVDAAAEGAELIRVLTAAPPGTSLGAVLAERPSLYRAAGLLQNLSDSPYALARVDFRDDDLVPIHLIHVLNAFCFGLEKTVDVQRRSLRGLIFENAPDRHSLAPAAHGRTGAAQ